MEFRVNDATFGVKIATLPEGTSLATRKMLAELFCVMRMLNLAKSPALMELVAGSTWNTNRSELLTETVVDEVVSDAVSLVVDNVLVVDTSETEADADVPILKAVLADANCTRPSRIISNTLT
jgi:hypothetical protein